MSQTSTCLIVDDEPLAIQLLEKHIQQFSQLRVVGSCWNAVEAYERLQTELVDLLFLDIQMPGLNGVDFLKSLRNPPRVIFTTAYREYAVESYDLEAIDYLVKPITFDRFFRSIQKFFDQLPSSSSELKVEPTTQWNFIYVNSNRRFIRVVFHEVLYVESLKDYLRIHTHEQTIITKEKISVFATQLPAYFLRVHRSFIVNTQRITAFTAHELELGTTQIPIGGAYQREVLEFLQANTGS